MPQKLTKFEYEFQKESIEQEIRGLEIEILQLKRSAKEEDKKAADWDLEKAKEGVRRAKLGYEQLKLSNDIDDQKKTQLEDQLEYEKAMTLVNKESLLTAGRTALIALQQAQEELENNGALFELKYRKSLSFSNLE